MVLTADAGGRCEVFAYDSVRGVSRQVTDRPHGTAYCTVDADGAVWWFDEDLAGRGTWRVQAFHGGPDLPALPPVPAGTSRGLAINGSGLVAAGVGGPEGLTVWLGHRGGPARPVFRGPGPLRLSGLSPDGALLAVSGPAAGRDAVTVMTSGGEVTARLGGGGDGHGPRGGGIGERDGRAGPDGRRGGRAEGGGKHVGSGLPGGDGRDRGGSGGRGHGAGRRVWAAGFAPHPGNANELLLVVEDGASYRLASWTPLDGLRRHDWCGGFDTEVGVRWYPDARRVLVRQERFGRSRLLAVDLEGRTVTTLATPPGSVPDAAPRPGGVVHYLWTDSATPPRPRVLAPDSTAATAPAPPPVLGTFPESVPGRHRELWTPGPDGDVHTLLSLPERRPGARPAPLVFLVHGGPADHDRDAYDGIVHSLVASGLGVARVNYRGSTGYGPRWRSAFREGVGLTQVNDLAAVRADLLRRGLAPADAIGLWGTSWGGYLTLLALGTRPGLWQAGVAVKPIADLVAAHRHGLPALRALDERLFGGTPDQLPDLYARSSPARYAAEVTAPVLVVAASQDAKCPPQQVRSYLGALRDAGVPHESLWLESGHDGFRGADHVAVLRRALEFLHAHLGARQAPRPGRDGAGPTVPRGGSAHAEGRHPQQPA
ncbi:S9 family peptidase [Streptomyces sp. MUM 203J]|nr:S9 family peptidase [Streptomyces sp. MUM 203J]